MRVVSEQVKHIHSAPTRANTVVFAPNARCCSRQQSAVHTLSIDPRENHVFPPTTVSKPVSNFVLQAPQPSVVEARPRQWPAASVWRQHGVPKLLPISKRKADAARIAGQQVQRWANAIIRRQAIAEVRLGRCKLRIGWQVRCGDVIWHSGGSANAPLLGRGRRGELCSVCCRGGGGRRERGGVPHQAAQVQRVPLQAALHLPLSL